jgi:hypothetical protein
MEVTKLSNSVAAIFAWYVWKTKLDINAHDARYRTVPKNVMETTQTEAIPILAANISSRKKSLRLCT